MAAKSCVRHIPKGAEVAQAEEISTLAHGKLAVANRGDIAFGSKGDDWPA